MGSDKQKKRRRCGVLMAQALAQIHKNFKTLTKQKH